jgi:hypothetical protein
MLTSSSGVSFAVLRVTTSADRFPDADADTYVRELEKLERELFEGRH